MAVNPYFDFLTKSVMKPTDALIIWDVDLAIQNSMCTKTTQEQRDHMWELFERTDGGVLLFTGRTHQSAETTFGHKYAGVYEHYSVARFGHGQDVTFMAPEIDVPQIGKLSHAGVTREGSIRVANSPDDIRSHSFNGSSDRAVFIELKNTSVALVHTTNGDHAHLESMRSVLKPLASQILNEMGLSETHMVKAGSDAVEMVPKGVSPTHKAGEHLPPSEIDRIHQYGLGKDIAVHNFHSRFSNRKMLITGDSKPDLDAMIVAHESYDGHGIFVSNGHSLSEIYNDSTDKEQRCTKALLGVTDHYSMTWPLIGDTVARLREQAPIIKIMGPKPSLQ